MTYVFLDIDGTLVDYDNSLPQSAIDAIKQAQANGHFVCTVTGRSKAEMYEEIVSIGFDGYIGANGNYVEVGDTVVRHKSIAPEDERKMVDWLHQEGLEFFLEANSGLYGSEHFEERGQSTMQAYAKQKGSQFGEHAVRQAFPLMKFGKALYRDDVNKISFILDDYADYERAVDIFSDFSVNTWGGVGETALFGDIALPNVDKRTGIQALLDYTGAVDAQTIAFGDAKVDIPMLEFADVGVAMGNGGPEIKAMADYVTADVLNDGLKKAFQHFYLI
ncbi:MAG: Cof-type HAD-IIB family hydrolase [Aerococcus sp.]|nr:Cof-type HAD-IIB family hydrolase [Aerococcus sp.]